MQAAKRPNPKSPEYQPVFVGLPRHAFPGKKQVERIEKLEQIALPETRKRQQKKPYWARVSVSFTRLPRSRAGRSRRDVHIPQPSFVAMRLERVSKHATQKIKGPKDVREKLAREQGKKAVATIRQKNEFLLQSNLDAQIVADERRRQRAINLVQAAVAVRENRFNRAMANGWGRVFGARGV